MLCYNIYKLSYQQICMSTTYSEEGLLSALVKDDCEASTVQIYSEISANRLAMFLAEFLLSWSLIRNKHKLNLSFR